MNGEIITQLPHDLQAEEAVIGSMLVGGPDAINIAQAELTEKEFYHPAHRIIFSAIISGMAAGQVFDVVTLTTALADAGLLEQVGGATALTRMFLLVPTAQLLSDYAATVREKYLLRAMHEGALKIMQLALEPTTSEELPAKLDFAQKFFTDLALAFAPQQTSFQAPEDAVEAAYDEIIAIYKGRGKTRGLDTGLYGLNRMTGGFKPGKVITIAARPSDGKTSLAMNIAEHVAVEEKVPVAIFSLEMDVQELWERMLLSRSRIDLEVLRTGFMPTDGVQRLDAAKGIFLEGAAPIYIESPTSLLRIFELTARARRAVLAKKVGLIIIDYIQLMVSGTKRGSENRVLEIAEITANVKMLARELRVPIIMLAQLSRRAEDRPGGLPRLADLRESGSIEQDSDIVIFIHRPERYETNDEQREALAGVANLIVAKNRGGPTNSQEGVPVVFMKQFVRFENHADEKFYSNNPAHRQRNRA